LPKDVVAALRRAKQREKKGSSAETVLGTILDNCALAAKNGTPLCQDTGALAFFVSSSLRGTMTRRAVEKAVRLATERGALRKNCIDSLTGESIDTNSGGGFPIIHYVDDGFKKRGAGKVTLVLKGGGSENMSRQYSLPDASLGAGRDLAGVRKCVLDAAYRAQGYGCAPGILGVAIGGDRALGYETAKEQFLRPVGAAGRSGNPVLAKFEKKLLSEINSLGIGPMGLGGETTVLDVKVASLSRLPASFFVTVAYMCWALRGKTAFFGVKEEAK
jgi:fumarate hydratase class I